MSKVKRDWEREAPPKTKRIQEVRAHEMEEEIKEFRKYSREGLLVNLPEEGAGYTVDHD